MREIIENIKENSQKLLNLSAEEKKNLILDLVSNLKAHFNTILEANAKDLKEFCKNDTLKDRLILNENRLENLCESLETIAYLDDPIHKVLKSWKNSAGLHIEKVSIPIGLICVIYEARPNLSAEIIPLMLKSSNACILKGGDETKYTNQALFNLVLQSLKKFKLEQCFILLETKEALDEILKFDDLIDLVIPRGSLNMIEQVVQSTKIPLIRQDKGLCHSFVDESANLNQAVKIIINAKCQRISVCNALETLLVHQAIAKDFFALLIPELEKFKVKIHANKKDLQFFKGSNLKLYEATPQTFHTEWLDYAMSVKVIKDVDEAIAHIQTHSSLHSEAILSNNEASITKFQRLLQSACIYVNASTRFSDGGEFGFGGEVGIATSKLHARGPMGIEDICTYKYLIKGEGQIRT